MLLLKYAGGECFGRVVVLHLNSPLKDYRSGVQMLVDVMHSAAGDFHARIDRLLLHVEAGEGREKAWMNVHDPVRESPNKIGRQQTHVAGKANEFHAASL